MKSHFYDKALEGVYDAVGGIDAFRRISARFHHMVESDPRIRGLFPKTMTALEERLALYLRRSMRKELMARSRPSYWKT